MNNTEILKGTFIIIEIPIKITEEMVTRKCRCCQQLVTEKITSKIPIIDLDITQLTNEELIAYDFPPTNESRTTYITGNLRNRIGADSIISLQNKGLFKFFEIPNEREVEEFSDTWRKHINSIKKLTELTIKFGILIWSEW